MAQLSSHLSSWMMVSVLICSSLLICLPALGQVNKKPSHRVDSTSGQAPDISATDTTKSKTESTIINQSLLKTKSFFTDLKGAPKQFGQLLQSARPRQKDTVPATKNFLPSSKNAISKKTVPDSLRPAIDSTIKDFVKGQRNVFAGRLKSVKKMFYGIFSRDKKKMIDSSGYSGLRTSHQEQFSKPLVKFGGGYVNYNYNYRSSVDTPFAERNINQHNVSGTAGVMLADVLPVNVNFWIRRSNSVVFRDITDIQVAFDPAAFRNGLIDKLRRRMTDMMPSINDSMLHKLEELKSGELLTTGNWLKTPFNSQRMREYREMIQINAMHPENMPTDSAARSLKEQQLKSAALFIKLYDSTRLKYDTLTRITDSLKNYVAAQRQKVARYRQVLNGRFSGSAGYSNWRNELNKYDPGGLTVPDKYKWLMGVRNFSLGKTPVNYSELTAKNINITGINFEYNSWYYLALSAGAIDYRFRDFVVGQTKRSPQYLVMLRAGIGRLEKNYFIVSVFKGQKQLYNLAATSSQPNAINVTGISAETKWQINSHTYVVAEAGQSVSPDYRSTPPDRDGKFTLKGTLNKAWSVKFYSHFPRLGARAEGLYKYTGANYQSFGNFQSNAAINTWYLKWEQSFFRRQIRITGALRSNEFTNPYLIQNYKSNTVFKSINATIRMRKWPVVTVGYMPMSQLSVVGQQIVENRFQTLTTSVSHFYKIGSRQAFTSFIFNRFYNTSADTGFVYFNASNFYLSQNFVFRLFSAGIGLADSRSTSYHLTSGEITLQIPLLKRTVCGMAIKVNHFNSSETKTGGKFNIDVSVTRKDRIGINYEKTWLPGSGRQLIQSDIGNVVYSRNF